MLVVPPPTASELAPSTRFNAPELEEMPALMLMLLCADSVSVALPPVVLLIAFAIVMSPLCRLVPALLVVMVTLMPLFSAA